MNKVCYFIILSLLIFFKVSASEKIAIVNIDFLLKNSKKGITIQEDFKKLNDKNKKIFTKKEKDLKEKESKLAAKKNVLSEEDFNNQLKVFSNEIKKYNAERKKIFDELNAKRNTQIVNLLKDINSILIEYSKENDISTTIDKKYVIITKSENDITKDILNLLNKK